MVQHACQRTARGLTISTLSSLGIGTRWEMLPFVMILIFLLGFPVEWIEIRLIVLPIFGPILARYDFSPWSPGLTAFLSRMSRCGTGRAVP